MSLQDHLADPKFRSYIANIQAKTGHTPNDLIRLARKKGFLAPGVKSGQIVAWLSEEFGLGRMLFLTGLRLRVLRNPGRLITVLDAATPDRSDEFSKGEKSRKT